MKKLGVAVLILVIGLLGYGIIQASASAAAPRDKDSVCHPVEGLGETKSGYNIIPPDQASSHLDEETGAPKHSNSDGRVDELLGDDLLCPGEEPPPEECPPGTENEGEVIPPGEDPEEFCNGGGNPTPVQFSGFSEPTPPTCESAGDFIQQQFEGITFSIDPAFAGPGTYTVTATLDDPVNTTFPDGTTAPKTETITVSPQLAVDLAECAPSEPPNPPNPPNPPGGPGGPGGPSGGPGSPTVISPPAGSPGAPSGGSAPVPTSIEAGL